jgi:hypothetical protein
MGPMNRTMLPPNGPPNMGNHVPGNQQQAHSPNYPQQLGRPSSRPSTPGQGVITNPSPSMAHRLPPGGNPLSHERNQCRTDAHTELTLTKTQAGLDDPSGKGLWFHDRREKVDFFPTFFSLLTHGLSSTEFSTLSRQVSYPAQPGPGAPQQPPTLPALPRHLSWHRRTFATTPRQPATGKAE